MTRNKYDSGEECCDEHVYEYDNESQDDEYFDEDDDWDISRQDEFQELIPQPKWKAICLGQTILDISDRGVIKPKGSLFTSSKGFAYLGTPYRTYTVEIEPGRMKEYFVHDLVWRAFNGDPPEGWEVRHTFDEAQRRRKYYSNALHNLTISQSTVDMRPKLFA